MRDIPGRHVPVNGRTVYAEESGYGLHQVAFEAGGGCGRTCWDPVLPFLAGTARLVTYDRAGRARSGPATGQLSIDDMADDLVAMQPLSRFRPLARLFSGNIRSLYSAGTYQAMPAENFTPAGTAQTRMEMQAVAAAILQFRDQPPRLPECPVTVLSVAHATNGRERQQASMREHQRRYADSLPDGRYEVVDSAHLIQAEQPQFLATRIQELFQPAAS